MNRPVRSLRMLIVLFGIVAAALSWTESATAGSCLEFVGRWPHGALGAIATSGHHAYYGSGEALAVVDVSDPSSPALLATLDLGLRIGVLDVADDLLFVAESNRADGRPTEFLLVDISDPAIPRVVSGHPVCNRASAVRATAGRLFVSCADGGFPNYDGVLRVYERGTSTVGPLLGEMALEHGTLAHDIEVHGHLLSFASGALELIDISDLDEMHPVGRFAFPSTPFGFPEVFFDVAFFDSVIVATTSYERLVTLSTSDLSTIEILGGVSVGGSLGQIVSSRGQPVVSGRYGLSVFDLADPENPRVSGSSPTEEAIGALAINNDIALGAASHTLHVFDLGDHSVPLEVGDLMIAGRPHDVSVTNDRAYILEGLTAVRVMDISDPSAILPIGWVETGFTSSRILVSGEIVYLLNRPYQGDPPDLSLRVLEFSDPENPRHIGRLDLDHRAEGMGFLDDETILVLSREGRRILTVDIHDPNQPTVIGEFETAGYAIELTIAGETVFYRQRHPPSDWELVAVDASNRRRLRQIWTADDLTPVAGDANYLYALGYGGFTVLSAEEHGPVFLGQSQDIPPLDSALPIGNRVYGWTRLDGIAPIVISPGEPPIVDDLYLFDGGGELRTGPMDDDREIVVVSGLGPIDILRGCHLVARLDEDVQGRTVHFRDLSIGEPTSWFWEFGDGTSSNEQNPSHEYGVKCGFEVTFTVARGEERHTTQQTVTVGNGMCETEVSIAVDQ